MNIIYSNYLTEDRGPPEVVPAQDTSYLPHNYYISMVISELCVTDQHMYEIKIAEIIDRLDNLISFVHEDETVRAITADYFHDTDNIREVLMTIQDSGLLRIEEESIQLSNSQLDYLRDYLLDYHHLD